MVSVIALSNPQRNFIFEEGASCTAACAALSNPQRNFIFSAGISGSSDGSPFPILKGTLSSEGAAPRLARAPTFPILKGTLSSRRLPAQRKLKQPFQSSKELYLLYLDIPLVDDFALSNPQRNFIFDDAVFGAEFGEVFPILKGTLSSLLLR